MVVVEEEPIIHKMLVNGGSGGGGSDSGSGGTGSGADSHPGSADVASPSK